MADVFTPDKRSDVMSRIRSRGTKIEERLYVLVRASLDKRFRVWRNVKTLPGRPDVVIPAMKIAVFADGCFYHCCPRHGRIPESNRAYWEQKLEANRKRDDRHRKALRQLGYSVWRFWEHDLEGKRLEITARRVQRVIGSWTPGRLG